MSTDEIAYPHVAERLFGRPLAIDPLALRAIMDGPLVRRVLSGAKLGGKQSKKGRDIRRDRLALLAQAEQVKSPDGLIEYGITAEGVAILPITGVLSRRFDWLAAACGFTTYDGLGATLDAIGDDYRVRGVLLDVDSPGGEADGMLDISDAILAARDGRPVWAVANSLAASAAYAIAGSAAMLYLPRLAQAGSIGCVTVHVDQSASDAAQGLNYTAIYSGARKVDGWGHAPLSEAARSTAQAGVDHVRTEFAALVGRQGRISQAAAMATEAQVYADQAAIDAGLADRIGTFNDALAALTEQVSPTRSMKGTSMSKSNAPTTAAIAPVVPAASAAAPEAAPVVAAAAGHSAEQMEPPKPGENCKLCGKIYDDADKDGDAKATPALPTATVPAVVPAAAVTAAIYGEAEISETMDVCLLAKCSLAETQAFIAAKTPVAKVRDALLAKLAGASDARVIQSAAVPSDSGQSSRMASWNETRERRRAQRGLS